MVSKIPLAAMIGLLLTVGAARADGASTGEADLAAIRALGSAYADTFNSRDAMDLATLFAEDGILMGEHAPASVGRANIELTYRALFEPGTLQNIVVLTNQVVAAGDYASARGTETLAGTGGDDVPKSVKWLATYRREPGGAWKILWRISNSNE
jgi:uncharacterized protein (TIGR02246 family)